MIMEPLPLFDPEMRSNGNGIHHEISQPVSPTRPSSMGRYILPILLGAIIGSTSGREEVVLAGHLTSLPSITMQTGDWCEIASNIFKSPAKSQPSMFSQPSLPQQSLT